MDKLLYVAMSGAKEILNAQAIRSNNLANVDTPGFKEDLAQARAMPVFGDTYPTRVYAMTERAGTDFSAGSLMTTDRDLDVALPNDGFFAVLDREGKEAYTRSGSFSVDAAGFLRTPGGEAVLGNGGPINLPPYESVEIGNDGTITIRGQGQGPESLTVVDRIKLVKPEVTAIEKGQDGLVRRKDGEIENADFQLRVVKGAVEGSNVDAVEAMMGIISSSRQFEMQVKMMKTAEELDAASARILHF
jgi:flagellar basal-body rod protein FlgF